MKTSFITPFGTFCYTTMPFGLESAGPTYQRGIQWCLHSQLGRNAEAYVDDMDVKTREDEGLISDLAETFDNLRKFTEGPCVPPRLVLRATHRFL
jgi:hypothetical protein